MVHKSQFIVAHPCNPPYHCPMVELVPAPFTTSQIQTRTRSLMSEVGQGPVSLSREVPGFALNRIQYALLNECWRLIRDGIVSAEVEHSQSVDQWIFCVRMLMLWWETGWEWDTHSWVPWRLSTSMLMGHRTTVTDTETPSSMSPLTVDLCLLAGSETLFKLLSKSKSKFSPSQVQTVLNDSNLKIKVLDVTGVRYFI